MTADERNARTNARDFKLDAKSMRDSAAHKRGASRSHMLALADAFDVQAANWLAKADAISAAATPESSR